MQTIYAKNFLKESKVLRKKYRTIDSDIEKFVNLIENEGLISSTRIPNLGDLQIYKTRIRNSSSASGKSGGFRVIYYLEIDTFCYFIAIYSKAQKTDISKKEILRILKDENLI